MSDSDTFCEFVESDDANRNKHQRQRGVRGWDDSCRFWRDTFAIPKPEFELDSKPANDLKRLSAPHVGAIKYLEQLDTPSLTSNVVDLIVGNLANDSGTSSDDDLDVTIGSVLKSGRFKCTTHKCRYKSFGRKAELQRHYDGTHAPRKRTFWCPVPLCKRSAGCGGKAFHREDKLRDHTRTMHGRDT
ncbi:hypothetical protein BKA63DRAFT_493568 [Paraphoma chrysanthemicola]|nr:hypothetical protein BKA63DRAFT_493568 [Paraphoma chrysanthemicola]